MNTEENNIKTRNQKSYQGIDNKKIYQDDLKYFVDQETKEKETNRDGFNEQHFVL